MPSRQRIFARFSRAAKGALSERTAALWFRLHGWQILRQPAQNLAQTDLLVRRGATLALVEVKCRATLPKAAQSLGFAQHRRLRAQARLVAARHPGQTLRLDLFCVAPSWPFFRHFPNAFPLARD